MEDKDDIIDDSDEKLSKTIIDTLDIIDDTPSKKAEEFETILSNVKEKEKADIIPKAEKIVDYKPGIRDLYIKNKRTKVLLTKAFSVIIICILLFSQFFISKVGDVLDSIIIYATNDKPIKIVENSRIGYIDAYGARIVNPKYIYGEDYVKNYAIVKNSNNLPLVIDRVGNEKFFVGEYFSLYRNNNYIIASKITKKGLKYGVFSSNLDTVVKFNYDLISAYDYCFSYVKGNTVGIINLNGKEIFIYKLNDEDNKKIYVRVSKSDNNNQIYGVVTVNETSSIINLITGKVVYNSTLNSIESKGNNLFLEINKNNNNNKKYIYIYDDKQLVNTDEYINITIPNITSGVIKVINKNQKVEFLYANTLRPVSSKLLEEDTFYGEDIFLYKTYDYKKSKVMYSGIKNFENIFNVYVPSVRSGFVNGFAIIANSDNKYNFIDKNGNILSDQYYDDVTAFSLTGYAIVKSNNKYGVINKYGKLAIKFEYDEIVGFNDRALKYAFLNTKKNIFGLKKDNKYIITDMSGNKILDKEYSRIKFDKKYDVIKLENDNAYLYSFKKEKLIKISSFDINYKSHENYYEIDNKLYNYSGKLIYDKDR